MKLRTGLAAMFLATILAACGSSEIDPMARELEKKYLSTLDAWVAKDGPVSDIQDTVIGTCGKLVLVAATASEKVALSTTQRAEFDFRVDVCAKMTVNRVHKQPEFEKPEILKSICGDSSLALFKRLCKHSGIGWG